MKKVIIPLALVLFGLTGVVVIAFQAPPVTPNIGLYLPPTGSYGWNTWFLANWAIIDTALGGGPSSTLSYVANLTGAVKRTLNGKLTETVSVTDFGAQSGGGFNNQVAFASALSALGTAGGTINIPCGTWFLGSTWNFTNTLAQIGNPVTVKGQGMCTVIEGTGITVVQVTGGNQTPPSVKFESLLITDSNTAGNASTVLMSWQNAHQASLEDVNLIGGFSGGSRSFLGTGLLINNTVCASIIDSGMSDLAIGVKLVGTSLFGGSTCLSFVNDRIANNVVGMNAVYAQINLMGTTIDGNSGGGILCGTGCVTRTEQVHFENNGAPSEVELTGGGQFFSHHSGFYGGTTGGILIDAASGSVMKTTNDVNTIITNNDSTANCIVDDPVNPLTYNGSGPCVYKEAQFYSYLGSYSNNFTYNLNGGVFVVTGGGVQTSGFVTSAGVIKGASYQTTSATGVTCSGTPTSSFASVNGIITHC